MVGKLFCELKVNDPVDVVVGILSTKVDTARNQSKYIKWTFADSRGGQMSAKRWNVTADELERYEGLCWAHAHGKVTEYKGLLEIDITQPLIVVSEPPDAISYLPSSPLPLEDLRNRLNVFIGSVQHPQLHTLLHAVFIDDTKLARRFESLPAAETRHHNFRHGLLQHTLEVADAVDAIASRQREWGGRGRFSRDLAITGALLHDIGKLGEYEQHGLGVRFSTGGGLIGHITQGAIRIARKIARVRNSPQGFSEELEELVMHLILSHHGEAEYGSPKPPMIAEAAVIHHADMMSAELFYFAEAQENAAEGISLYNQWKMDDKGRHVYVGQIAGLWESIDEIKTATGVSKGYPALATADSNQRALPPSVSFLPLIRLVHGEETNNFATVQLPLVGRVAAGLPILDSDNVEGTVLVEAEGLGLGRGDYYLLRVQGDSMIEDGILDGDLIVVRHQEQAEWGDIVVAALDEGATVKRLVNQNGQITLKASNPAYDPIIVPDPELLSIQGRVIAIAR